SLFFLFQAEDGIRDATVTGVQTCALPISVILMVAITVVLAATVYVWVSGFGSQPQAPARSVSLTSNAPLANNLKTYTVSSATSEIGRASCRERGRLSGRAHERDEDAGTAA